MAVCVLAVWSCVVQGVIQGNAATGPAGPDKFQVLDALEEPCSDV